MTEIRTPVTIIGGGMVGLTTAVALAQGGLDVCVIDALDPEKQVDAGRDGRVSALAYGSRLLLENLQIWPHLEPHAQPIWDIRVVDENSPVSVHYDHQQLGDEPMGHIAENCHIRQAIAERAKHLPRITLLAPARWRSIQEDPQGVTLTLEDGRTLRSDLLIAADGKFSRIRQRQGIVVMEADYNQTALVATIAHELPHHGLALERFRPAGPFAVLPMQGNYASLVWVEDSRDAACYARLNKETLECQIQLRVGEYLGAIELAGPVSHYPLKLILAQDYTKGRVVLAGDAAHGIHPIAGQGVNLGFRDVARLAELILKQARLGMDIGNETLLADYAAYRRGDAMLMAGVTDGINRLFSNNIFPLKLARNLGFLAVEKLPAVKAFFMLHAMGMKGALPPLMQKSHG